MTFTLATLPSAWFVMAVLSGTLNMNQTGASSGQAQGVAVIEAPSSVTRHLSIKDGRLLVDTKHEWRLLRHFDVRIIETPAPNVEASSKLPENAAFRLQLKPDKFGLGINSVGNVPGVGDEHFPFFVLSYLHVRVQVQGKKGEPGEFAKLLHGSYGVKTPPDAGDRVQALGRLLRNVDDALQQAIGVRMLRVEKRETDGQTSFAVRVENVFPFAVRGSVRFPEEKHYRAEPLEHAFHLEPGESTVQNVRLAATSGEDRAVYPAWWKGPFSNVRERYAAFRFSELVFNAPPRD